MYTPFVPTLNLLLFCPLILLTLTLPFLPQFPLILLTPLKVLLTRSSSLFLQRSAVNHIPFTPSLNTSPTNTSRHTPITTPVQQQTQTSLTLPLSDTDFPLTHFNITPTQSPPPFVLHIPGPSDIDPLLLRNINQPTPCKPLHNPTSIKSLHRRSQFDRSLPTPPHLVLTFHLIFHFHSKIHYFFG